MKNIVSGIIYIYIFLLQTFIVSRFSSYVRLTHPTWKIYVHWYKSLVNIIFYIKF